MALFRNKLMLIIAALVIAGGVWYGLSLTPATPDLTATPSTTSSSPSDQGIVSILLTLRAIKLDGTIFSEPAFMQLKDFSTEIVPEPVGRTNPFAPLSARSEAMPGSTKSAPAPIFKPVSR